MGNLSMGSMVRSAVVLALGYTLLAQVSFAHTKHRSTAAPPPDKAVHQTSNRLPRDNSALLAKMVTIYRDVYGVPHVFGKTDASTVFGFAYAQAEDNFWRVEENFILALGRAAELYGDRMLEEDRLNRALGIPRLAREEYSRLDKQID